MELARIAGTCPDGNTCPTFYKTDRGTVVVQGNRLPDAELAEMNLPEGEIALEVPEALLEEVARAYRT